MNLPFGFSCRLDCLQVLFTWLLLAIASGLGSVAAPSPCRAGAKVDDHSRAAIRPVQTSSNHRELVAQSELEESEEAEQEASVDGRVHIAAVSFCRWNGDGASSVLDSVRLSVGHGRGPPR